jgi:hypothetical protein
MTEVITESRYIKDPYKILDGKLFLNNTEIGTYTQKDGRIITKPTSNELGPFKNHVDRNKQDDDIAYEMRRILDGINYDDELSKFPMKLSEDVTPIDYIKQWSVFIDDLNIRPIFENERAFLVNQGNKLDQEDSRRKEILIKNFKSFVGAVISCCLTVIISTITMADEKWSSKVIITELAKIGAVLTVVSLGFSDYITAKLDSGSSGGLAKQIALEMLKFKKRVDIAKSKMSDFYKTLSTEQFQLSRIRNHDIDEKVEFIESKYPYRSTGVIGPTGVNLNYVGKTIIGNS